jgi:uncharacterized protein (TIGR03083 family)
MLDTRPYFRPLTVDFLALLRSLSPGDWDRPTAARGWQVRDVVAHLTDTAFRRVSFHRDGHVPPPPLQGDSLVTFINRLNAEWVLAMRRASPRVLVDLFALAATQLADWIEQLPLESPPLFPVSWAGEDGNQGWLDIGREFTEQWHHQMQVREAVGTPSPDPPEWLHAVLTVLLQGLPHAYREVVAAKGTTIHLSISGDAGSEWSLRRGSHRWHIESGPAADAAVTVSFSDDAAWRLLFNALPETAVEEQLITWSGRDELILPLLKARSVIV